MFLERTNMEETQSQNQKATKIAIILLIILFNVVIATIAIINAITAPSGSIEPVSNTSSTYFSQIDTSSIEQKLIILLKSYYDASPKDLTNLKAVIRENTLTYKLDNDNQLTEAKFLIDLNEPQLTYQVEYQKDGSEIMITCPPIELAQNQDIFCIGLDTYSTIDSNLDKYLPYRGVTPSGVQFSIKHDRDSNNMPRLDIYANICNDETKGKEVENTVKEWIQSKNIPNPSIIPTNINYSDCYYKEN